MSEAIVTQDVIFSHNGFVQIFLSKNQKEYPSVKYANQFNRSFLGNLTPTHLDILHAIFVEIKKYVDFNYSNIDFQTNIQVAISFDEIYELCSLHRKHTSEKDLLDTIIEFSALVMEHKIQINDNDCIEWTHFFQSVLFNKKEKNLYIKMSPLMLKSLLIEFDNGYTEFDFVEFLSLKSRYSKILYRMLKQYKYTGIMNISLEEFKKVLGIPESYRYVDIKRQILDKSIKELAKPLDLIDRACNRILFVGLKVQPVYDVEFGEKKGRKAVSKLKFTFKRLDPPSSSKSLEMAASA